LLRLSGVFLLRLADRQFSAVLFLLPPRLTRLEPFSGQNPKAFYEKPPKTKAVAILDERAQRLEVVCQFPG